MKKSFLRGVIGTIFFFGVFLSFANFSYAQEESNAAVDALVGFGMGVAPGASLIGGAVNYFNGGSFWDGARDIIVDSVGLGDKDNIFANAIQTIYATGLVWFSKLAGWIATAAGYIFEKALYTTTQYDEKLGAGIFNSWKIIRDLSNIIIVFSLLYLAILTIWEGQGFAQKKVLAGIILAAILINFSFFFTKNIAFDMSNYIGHQILEQIKPENGSISSGFMNIVSPQQILDNKYTGYSLAQQNEWDGLFKATGQVLLLSFVVIMLAVVFLGSALTLIYRYLIFILLIILSPFGLISSQIPFLKSYGSKWWDALKKQTLFFPAYVICMYVILTLVSTLVTSNESITVNVFDGSGVSSFLFTFILIMGFMIGLLILPGMMGAAGAGFMTNAGNFTKNKLRNLPKSSLQFAGNRVSNRSALVGQRLFGKGLSADKIKDLQSQTTSPDKKIALKAQKKLLTNEKTKDKTYDFRNTGLGKKLGLGTGIKSWNTQVEESKKQLEEKHKKEQKIFGLDKEKDPQAVIQAEAERNFQSNVVEQHNKVMQKAYADEVAGTIDKVKRDEILKREGAKLELAKKALEEKELAVGKAKNKGQVEHLKIMKAERDRLSKKGKWSAAQEEGMKRMEKDIEKKWKEEGRSKQPKKKTGAVASVTTSTGSGTTSSTSSSGGTTFTS